MKKLKYEKYRNSNEIITIDLHNGYTVIAISTRENGSYITTLFLKENNVDTWKLIENAEFLEMKANSDNINSAILKQVSALLEKGFFDYYIERYEYDLNCFDIGDEIIQKERLGVE